MPGMFVATQREWKPAMLARFENGKIAVDDLKNERIMGAVVKEEPDPSSPGKKVTLNKRQELGAPIMVPDPADKTRMIQLVTPDPAAVEAIQKMTGNPDATAFEVTPPPMEKKADVIVNTAGDSASAQKIAELTARLEQQGKMIEALAAGKK